jgi:hypothetical protein
VSGLHDGLYENLDVQYSRNQLYHSTTFLLTLFTLTPLTLFTPFTNPSILHPRHPPNHLLNLPHTRNLHLRSHLRRKILRYLRWEAIWKVRWQSEQNARGYDG